MTARLRSKLPWFALAAGCLAADLWSKHLVFYPHVLEPGFREGLVVGRVFPGWQTVLAYNRGVTFGMGSGLGDWFLALGTAGVIAFLAWKLWRTPTTERAKCLALSMIVGGATGNLYDRALRPHVEPDTRPGVRDFLDWYVPEHWSLARFLREDLDITTHWYTSNVADVLIVCGVGLLAWKILREPADGAAQSAKPPESAA